jgi:hypothetical protein
MKTMLLAVGRTSNYHWVQQICVSWMLLASLLWLVPAGVNAQFQYATNNNGTITITRYTGSGGAVAIPGMTNGLVVDTIGDKAFYGASSVTSVTFPNSVTSIGTYAFWSCRGLSSLTVPGSVISIGDNAFRYCTGLTNVTILDGVIGLGRGAFFQCTSLPGVSIPTSITGIGDAAFGYCTSLMAITVDADNPRYSSLDGSLFNKNRTILIQYATGRVGDYSIPDGVTSISEAFAWCYGLTRVTIPNSVTSIGDWAFNYCYGITNVTIPNSVTSIGYAAFGSCTRLSKVTIPNSVTSIGDWAFDSCSGLISVTMPNSTPTMGSYVFSHCSNLRYVFFGGNEPSSYGGNTFYGTSGATIYYLPTATGWGWVFDGSPTLLWNPQVQRGATFGVRTNRFGFNITGTSGLVVVVEGCTNLSNPFWSPLATSTLAGGAAYFSDPHWTNYPARFYRLRWP